MIITFKNFVLDVDIEKTREFYCRKDINSVVQVCSCPGCRNFDKAIDTVPDKVAEFFDLLGIDPHKPAEVYNVTNGLEKDGSIWYNGWYHVCGSIIKSPENLKKIINKNGITAIDYGWDNGYTPDGDYPFMVLPVNDIAFIHDEFPHPVIQLEIDMHLPYVLPEPFEA